MPGQIGTGALSYLGYGLEAVKGVPPSAINDFLFITANNTTATPDVIRKHVMAGDRAAQRIIRPSKFKIHGTLSHPLYGNSGAQFIMAALGLDTYLAPIAGTYTVGSTSNGLTTFTSSDAITPGAWTTWGTGAAQEIRTVIPATVMDPSASATSYLVAALSPANQSASGSFAQPGQHKFSPIPHTSPLVYTLPTLTLEMNEGGQWAWQLAGTHVGQYNIKGGKEDVEISSTVAGTVMPRKLPYGSFTAFNPTSAELADVARPFTINDGYVIVPSDPGATGTSTLQIANSIEDWEADYKNGLLEKAFWDGGQVYKVFPGESDVTIKYKYAISAGRPDAYEDFLVKLHAQPIPFVTSMALNVGTPSVPTWYAYGVYVPSTIMTKADVARSVSDVLTMNIEADGLITQAGTDLMNIFVINNSTAAYVGS